MIGIKNNYRKAAQTNVAASVVPVTVGLSVPIAANEKKHLRYWVPVTVGAAGGVRAIVNAPAAPTQYRTTILLYNTVAGALVKATQAAEAEFNNALANAGTHWLQIDLDIVNGANAGTIDLQMAQDTSDATALNVLAGATLEETIF